jgi:hypothetical protein
VKVLRIAATATTSGIKTAGSVPKTNRRMISAPMPPINVSTRALEFPLEAWLFASSSASRPVTLTVVPAGRPFAATARILTAPLFLSTPARPGR